MAKRRLVVGGAGLRPVQRQPAVRVRDDFNAGAARAASSDLQAIATGLGQLAPKLGQLAGQLQEKKWEEGRATGAARLAELIQEQGDYASAMRQGLIEAKDNPYFRVGLMEAAGVIAGDQYGDSLRVSSGSLEDRADMAGFDNIQAETYEAAQKRFGPERNNKHFNQAFQNRAMGHTQSARARFAEGQSAAMLEQRADLLYEEAASGIHAAIAENLVGPALADVLTLISDTGYAQGLDGELVNATMANAISDTARSLAETDPHAANRLLDAVEARETGVRAGRAGDERRPLLADTADAKAVFSKARHDVRVITQEVYNQRAFQEAEAKRIEGDAIRSDAMISAFETPDVDDVDWESLFHRAAMNGDERLLGQLITIRDNSRTMRWYTDQEKFASAQIAIWEPGSTFGLDQVMTMLELQTVTSADATELRRMVLARDSYIAGSVADNPLNAATFKQFPIGYFTSEFRDKFGFQGGELFKRAHLALNGYRADYLRVVESGEFGALTLRQQNEYLEQLSRAHIDLHGGGRTTVESISERGTSAPTRIHDVEADWTEVVVLTRGEILQIRDATTFSELDRSLQELVWQFIPSRGQWAEFRDSQVRLLYNQLEETENNEE
jgi:hypothetical protein